MDQRLDFRTAIESQPGWMARAAGLAADALGCRERVPWSPGETVVVVGMGASTHAGAVFAEALRAAGFRAINLDASAVGQYPDEFHPGEHAIVISESGRSPEPIAAARRLGVAPVVVTNDPASPVTELADVVVPLGGFTDSGVYTIGYTTTLVALAAVARAHGVDLADPAGLADVAGAALADFAGGAREIAPELGTRHFLDIVGRGVSFGSAQAAALLFREATATPTAAYESIQYLHGPMECDGADGAVLIYGEGREDAIAAQLRDAGVLVAQVVTRPGPGEPAAVGQKAVYRLSRAAHGYAGAIAEIVFAQLLAAELAGLRGIDVGKFRFPQPDTKLDPATEPGTEAE